MKITQEQRKAALIACEKLQVNEVFVNKHGEMFTSENAAANSVKNKKTDYAKVEAVAIVENADDDTNDFIVYIELNEDIDELKEILEDERAGLNRPAVIKACELQITELEKTDE